MLSGYVEIIELLPRINDLDVSDPLLSDVESAEIKQLHLQLELFSFIIVDL